MRVRVTRGDGVQLAALALVGLALVLAWRAAVAPVDMSAFAWDTEMGCWTTSRHVPALGAELDVEVYPESAGAPVSPRQAAVLAALDHLPADFSDRLDEAAEANRAEFDRAVDLRSCGLGHINRGNIGEHYRLTSLVVPQLSRVRGNYFFLAGECDWEVEHGLEMIVKDGVVVSQGANECRYMAHDWGEAVESNWLRRLMRWARR